MCCALLCLDGEGWTWHGMDGDCGDAVENEC